MEIMVGNIQKSFFSAKLLLLFTISFGILSGTAIAAPKPVTKALLKAQIAAVNAARVAADSAEAAARQAADTAEASTRQATDNALSAAINSSKHFLGEQYGGGIVFYVYDDGQHGLIAAPADQGTNPWSAVIPAATKAIRDGIGAGLYNTERIIINQGFALVGDYAPMVCAKYQGGSFGDWYLPSKAELNLLFQQKSFLPIVSGEYWSSNQTATTGANTSTAYSQDFGTGTQFSKSIDTQLKVRAIRAF
jgi:hypothetical protein